MRVGRVLGGAVMGFVAGAWIAGALTWLWAATCTPCPPEIGEDVGMSFMPCLNCPSLVMALLVVFAGSFMGTHLGALSGLIYDWRKAHVTARARLGWTVVLPTAVILVAVLAAANDSVFGSLGDATARWYLGFAMTVALSGYLGHWLATGRPKPVWGRIALYACLGAAAYSLANLTVLRGPD